MNAQLAASVLGLSFTLADTHLTRNGERNFWKSPTSQSPVHWLYMLSRYFAIVAQICDFIIASFWKYKYTAIPPNVCFMHMVFKSAVSYVSLLLLDAILMLRVYALYSKSQEIASFLAFTLLMRFISGVWVLTQLFDISIGSLNFNYICIAPQQLHKEPKIAIFVFGEMAIQGILCCLTLLKTWSLGSLEWPHAQNLASVLNRDALSVFVVLSGTFAAIIVSTYKSGLGVLFVFPALTSVTSCAGCRLILHLHRLGERETSAGPEDTMFTSIDATGTWDTQTHHVRT